MASTSGTSSEFPSPHPRVRSKIGEGGTAFWAPRRACRSDNPGACEPLAAVWEMRTA
jgi:hypothetical protein